MVIFFCCVDDFKKKSTDLSGTISTELFVKTQHFNKYKLCKIPTSLYKYHSDTKNIYVTSVSSTVCPKHYVQNKRCFWFWFVSHKTEK